LIKGDKNLILNENLNQRAIQHISFTMNSLIQLVDSMFKVALEDPEVLEDVRAYENLSLKYISFV
jgi:hypothetical protein